MTRTGPYSPVYKAGLTRWAMPFDRTAGARTPQIPEDPGIVHAVRPMPRELKIREPYFIEDTGDYRAALCGALVKIIMPNTFKTEEAEACPDCIAETARNRPYRFDRPGSSGNPFSGYIMGDRWSPGRWRRKHARRGK